MLYAPAAQDMLMPARRFPLRCHAATRFHADTLCLPLLFMLFFDARQQMPMILLKMPPLSCFHAFSSLRAPFRFSLTRAKERWRHAYGAI